MTSSSTSSYPVAIPAPLTHFLAWTPAPMGLPSTAALPLQRELSKGSSCECTLEATAHTGQGRSSRAQLLHGQLSSEALIPALQPLSL